jgi:hypothetical protein
MNTSIIKTNILKLKYLITNGGDITNISYTQYQNYLDKYYSDDEQILIESIIALHENYYKDGFNSIKELEQFYTIVLDDISCKYQIIATIGFDLIKKLILDKNFKILNPDYKIEYYDKKYNKII